MILEVELAFARQRRGYYQDKAGRVKAQRAHKEPRGRMELTCGAGLQE